MRDSTILGSVTSLTLALVVSVAPSGRAVETTTQVLWRDPGPLGTKDLYWGPGNADEAPRPPFAFVKEDHLLAVVEKRVILDRRLGGPSVGARS